MATSLPNWVFHKVFTRAGGGVARLYRANEGRLRRRFEKRSPMNYDDRTATFHGGDMARLLGRNYEKALRNLWKAEIVAPYLGIHDASTVEKAARQSDGGELSAMLESATSDSVRRELAERFSPEERRALWRIISLIVHGEAYALYTSASLLPVVEGTGAKLGMAMQVMEEAKHFLVLRAMVTTVGELHPATDSARILLDNIASQEPYAKLFGMNVIVESVATSIFSRFADYPGLCHILPHFHRDEARHCGFAKSYADAGGVPASVTRSMSERRRRMRLIVPALPVIFDYKADFETLGYDVFEFFGKFLSKVTRLAEDARLPLHLPRTELLARLNLLANAWVYHFEPERWTGYRDYTLLGRNDIREDLVAAEREVYGQDIFSGLSRRALDFGRRVLEDTPGRRRAA